MIAWCITDSSTLTQNDLDSATWTFCKKVSDQGDVSTTGTVLHNYGGGHYILDNPNATQDTLFQVPVNGNILEGIFAPTTDPTLQAMYTYVTGKTAKGTIIAPLAEATVGKPLVIYQATSYEAPNEIQIVVGADWALMLDGSLEPWFCASYHSQQVTPNIEVLCTIFDQAKGILKFSPTVVQTNIDTGNYRWQVVLKNTLGDRVHVSAEGKLDVKPNLMKVEN